MPFYAVRCGRKPGIYESWDEAKLQVDGYSKAECRKFETKQDARNYMSVLTNIQNASQKRNAACEDEGSASKDETVAQVNGYSNAEFKKFSTEQDARAYLSVPLEVTEAMTTEPRSDGGRHMDEQAFCSQPAIKHDVESSCVDDKPQEPIAKLPCQPKSEPITSDPILGAAPSKDYGTSFGWAGLKKHRTEFEKKLPTHMIVSKLHASGLLLDCEYAEIKGKKNNSKTNRKLIDFLLCKDDELVEDFKKELSEIHGYSHLVRLL